MFKKKVLNILSRYETLSNEAGVDYSFMNFASLTFFFNREDSSLGVSYFCDGMLMSTVLSILLRKKIERVSFDYSSIAGVVFNQVVKDNMKICIIGAEEHQLACFIEKVKKKHPGIDVAYRHNGYFYGHKRGEIFKQIIDLDIGLVVVGLGAGKQEDFICALREFGYKGTSYTCGGFIRQESLSENEYYPVIVKSLGLRAFYRMYKEPHTIKRYLLDYPINFIKLLFLYMTGRVKIKLT